MHISSHALLQKYLRVFTVFPFLSCCTVPETKVLFLWNRFSVTSNTNKNIVKLQWAATTIPINDHSLSG